MMPWHEATGAPTRSVYPELLAWIGQGRIKVRPFVERHPLNEINQVFDAAHHGQLSRRAVLTPA